VPHLHLWPWRHDRADTLGAYALLAVWGLHAIAFAAQVLGRGLPDTLRPYQDSPAFRATHLGGLKAGFLSALIVLGALLPLAFYAPGWVIPALPLAITVPVSLAGAFMVIRGNG